MLLPIEQLLILQHTDQQVCEITQALCGLPEEKKACEAALEKAAKLLLAVQARAQEFEKEIKKLELEILSKKEQIARYRTQQLATRKNEEYTAFLHEIATAEQVISTLEERQLKLMEEGEALLPERERAQEINAIEQKRVNAILGTLEGRRINLEARKKELLDQRTSLSMPIEEELLEHYERLFKSRGTAVVPIEHGVCTGCHMKVTAQTILTAKAEKEMLNCPQCGRILFTEED
ncbi:MAG: hypothetical protein K2W99_00065 [Chthoniobacterales bacterium]|nr:hypothetical protein [Chthoniobacterales bacterium]